MKSATTRHTLLAAAVMAMAALGGCADVRQNPASQVVSGQADSAAPQAASAQPASATNIPF